MNKHIFRAAALRGTALLLFFALAFGVTAASAGLLGNSADDGAKPGQSPLDQLLRPPTSTSSSSSPVTESPETSDDPPQPPLQAVYVQNLSTAFHTGLIEGYTNDRTTLSITQRVELYNRLTASLGTVDDALSPLSYQSYTSDAYQLAKRLSLDYDYLEGTEIITEYTKLYSDQDGSYQTIATRYLIGRETVQPYMGYLLISRVETRQVAIPAPSIAADLPSDDPPEYETVEVTVLALYDHKGNLLVEDLGTKVPYYARDLQNRPVFEDENGKLYAFNGTNFVSVDSKDLRIGLFYDYPAYPLGTYNDVYEAKYNPSLNGYHYINYKTGRSVISTGYSKAFNFSSNGLAVIMTKSDRTVQIINTQKRQAFKPGSRYSYNTGVDGHKQTVKDYYALPDTFGIESIGSAGYDNGWLRLRIQIRSMMSDSLGTIVKDYEVLVDAEGNRFDIPEGYTIEGYSDGVLLLSKDGLYGYYSISGDWIAQPIFTYARPFVQGLAVVGSEAGTVGMIDTQGNIVLPFVFTSISDVSSGVITTYCEGIGWETYELIEK